MPWKARTVMAMREEFVQRVQQKEESMSALCREYGISRKTGYKWLHRAQRGEPMSDRSRAPHHPGGKVLMETEELILSARDEHPAWGARKLERYLNNKGYDTLPCKSTIGNILKRNNRIEPEESAAHMPFKRFERSRPNDLWQMDFKGDFLMADNNRCYPLTILDDHSRFSLCVAAQLRVAYQPFYPVMCRIFEEYGLPSDILCDNGKPWGDSAPGITAFDVWMMQLGVLPIHIRAKHPQTQGKEERFHRTLKNELLKRRSISDICDAQAAFDQWREEYNHERPHEALQMDVPAQHYRPSRRAFTATLNEPDYEAGAQLRKVNCKGYISIGKRRYFLSDALINKFISLHDDKDDTLVLCYGDFQVAKINLREQQLVSKHIYRWQ